MKHVRSRAERRVTWPTAVALILMISDSGGLLPQPPQLGNKFVYILPLPVLAIFKNFSWPKFFNRDTPQKFHVRSVALSLKHINKVSNLISPVTTLTKSHESRSPTDGHEHAADRNRRQIDQEVQRLEDSIRTLKSRRNILAPISRIPPEMLSKIFSYRTSESSEGNNPLEWIRLTHVSRYWRAVALDCPSLWGNLVFSRPKWSEEMLKRSKMANLTIKADLICITPKIFEAVRLALLHGPRVQELQLLATSATIERLLGGTSFEAPMLQSLSLAVPRYSRIGSDEGATLPGNVLCGETPYLRRVELRKCNLRWDSALLSGLTHLKIHDITPSARPTTRQLIDALERMPALEVLDLQEALPATNTILNSPSDPIIDFPRITLFTIKSSVPECNNLISRISIPSTARIQLSCSGTEATGDDFSSILKFLPRTRNTSNRFDDVDNVSEKRTVRSMQIMHEAPLSLLVQCWEKAGGVRVPVNTYGPIDIQLHLSCHSSTVLLDVDSIITAVCKEISVSQLHVLRLSNTTSIEKDTWINNFGTSPYLREVHIEGNSTHTFIAALRAERTLDMPISSSPASATGDGFLTVRRPGLRRRKSTIPHVYFPALKILRIEDANFEGIVPISKPFEDFRDCLIERYERKAEVQELMLWDCSNLAAVDVDLLREIVVDIDWDLVEQGFTDDEEYRYQDEDYDDGYSDEGLELDPEVFGFYGDYDSDGYVDTESEFGF